MNGIWVAQVFTLLECSRFFCKDSAYLRKTYMCPPGKASHSFEPIRNVDRDEKGGFLGEKAFTRSFRGSTGFSSGFSPEKARKSAPLSPSKGGMVALNCQRSVGRVRTLETWGPRARSRNTRARAPRRRRDEPRDGREQWPHGGLARLPERAPGRPLPPSIGRESERASRGTQGRARQS